ncbi:hypothetical protein [Mucilaginibacter sp. OK283]|jgi:hypothetical protein|uniref:hypothetical protein n=1 Tax=Mucilaginibacter sp. OK283 TaxID=1881049 RepID=UPI0008B3FB7E|nr:hypothetical protein [Mucilaginibacter sp. OK283]SEO10616.1 hypothetical protein SAMN05428947_101321 [Mucilaginibacter sp. OK283]
MPPVTKTYSAIDLLDKVFEFVEMTPNPNEWNLRSLKSNPPRQIRFRQIDALLKAFFIEDPEIGLANKVKSIFFNQKRISIESLLNGGFLKERTIYDYANLARFINDFVKKRNENIDQSNTIGVEQLIFIFPQLLAFKRQLRNLLTFNSGWLEAGGVTSLFSIYLTSSISNNLIGKYDELNIVLELFINPKGLTFTEEELIAKFNFPTENLDALDADFI